MIDCKNGFPRLEMWSGGMLHQTVQKRLRQVQK